MFKVPKQVYTAEFKLAAVQRVSDGQGVAVVARELGISEQTLRNWVKAGQSGKSAVAVRPSNASRMVNPYQATRSGSSASPFLFPSRKAAARPPGPTAEAAARSRPAGPGFAGRTRLRLAQPEQDWGAIGCGRHQPKPRQHRTAGKSRILLFVVRHVKLLFLS